MKRTGVGEAERLLLGCWARAGAGLAAGSGMEVNLRNVFLGEIDDRCHMRGGREGDIHRDYLVCIAVEKNWVLTA